jgi:hypothetical protein
VKELNLTNRIREVDYERSMQQVPAFEHMLVEDASS